MQNTAPNEQDPDGRSILRNSRLWRRPEAAARGELVWNAEGAVETVEVSSAPSPQSAETAADIEDALRAEIDARRRIALAELDAELEARRLELRRRVEQERDDALARVAEAERLERDALATRSDAIDRAMLAEQSRVIAERVEALVTSQLSGLKQRAAEGEARLQADLEVRRRELAAQLEEWRVSERERIAAELAADERRFNERLLRHLDEFNTQLAERMHEQQQRLARAWPEVQEQVRARIDAAFEDALKTPSQ